MNKEQIQYLCFIAIITGLVVIAVLAYDLISQRRKRKMGQREWFKNFQEEYPEEHPSEQPLGRGIKSLLDDGIPSEAQEFVKEVEKDLNKRKANNWMIFISGMINRIKNEYPDRVLLPIKVDAPPCVKCKHWIPRVGDIKPNALIQGMEIAVRICWAEEMMRDFGCYEPRGKE